MTKSLTCYVKKNVIVDENIRFNRLHLSSGYIIWKDNISRLVSLKEKTGFFEVILRVNMLLKVICRIPILSEEDYGAKSSV